MKLLLIRLEKSVKFGWKLAAYLDTSNQTIITTWFQQENKFTVLFESTCAITLRQLFAFSEYLLNSFRNYAR